MTRFRISMLVASCVLMLGLEACGSETSENGPQDPPVETEQIAFSSRRLTGSRGLFLMDPDGSNVRPVLADSWINQTPVLSPDGRRIAFVSDRDGNEEIYVINVDGTGMVRLTDTPAEESSPTWSPDGARIAFTRRTGTVDGNGLILINLDGTGETTLLPQSYGEIAWSPNNTGIAYGAEDGVWMLPLDGGAAVHLVATDLSAHDPAWSPDGSMIAFGSFSDTDSNQEIFVANADGTGIRNLTRTPAPAGEIQPAWSPDGQSVVFTGFRNENQEVVRRNLDGSGEVILTDLGAEDQHPTWGPVP